MLDPLAPNQESVPNLIILRHGETDGNAHRVLQCPDTPLNAQGKQQAQRAAQRIVEEHGTQLVIRTSDYTRAQQTAEALAVLSSSSMSEDHLLRERNLGEIRGRSYDDLGFDPFGPTYEPPGGESWQQFFSRVAKFWTTVPSHLARLPEGHVLVLVTHGLVCRALATDHLNVTQARYPSHIDGPDGFSDHWPNTSITKLRTSDDTWNVITMNCGRHLEASGLPGGIA